MDTIKTLFGFALLLAFSLVSGLASILLASLLAVVTPLAIILAAGAASHLGYRLFKRGIAEVTVNDVA